MSEAQNSQRIADLQKEMAELQLTSGGARARLQELESELLQLKGEAGQNVAWERVKLARHPKRPHSLDYIQRIAPDFTEIHGDRNFGDDPAIVCGFGTVGDEPVNLTIRLN
jgi:acetyl-CoA carboxylase carboxyl transferase subunit alpha